MRVFFLSVALSAALLSSTVSFPQSPAQSSTPAAAFAEKLSLPGIHNAGKVSERLFRGAQPQLAELSELKKLGVTTIVDLRSEFSHTRERERAEAESLGIHFVSIPVGGFSTPTSAQLAEFFALLRQSPPQKIFVHCAYGDDRTGVFIAAYRMAFDHWSADQAYSEMLAYGFHRHWHHSMASFVRFFPDHLQSDPVLKSALANP
ncbi:MAG TPA: tyrosine-protein phosphatase [Candidatus Limnocylindrales bacterium]|nr:tyrosine-protein phosphatase [Candidatus Limnocylindrales bacterium]